MHEEEDQEQPENTSWNATRREFLSQVSLIGAGVTIAAMLPAGAHATVNELSHEDGEDSLKTGFWVNGKRYTMYLDPRTTLLDALREKLQLMGTKKGCDRGQCGACTVLVNGRRVNSCLTLAGMCGEAKVTTIEGLADGDTLHPMQEAFIKHDAFQCGYCTPGQICSAIGLLQEGRAHTDADIREGMSGNICRCGAYQNILHAIKEVKEQA